MAVAQLRFARAFCPASLRSLRRLASRPQVRRLALIFQPGAAASPRPRPLARRRRCIASPSSSSPAPLHRSSSSPALPPRLTSSSEFSRLAALLKPSAPLDLAFHGSPARPSRKIRRRSREDLGVETSEAWRLASPAHTQRF
ncbi:hypothetical protein PR202_ga29866 [Eleusine coracana subsp. coracana]|uniref:Uncharacterized protein n=1 Tax=Eleusine coracana subsp. coracana TaxID=191504 RepID=A0AAV5DMV3_ELECO|nr:hypothetical protein PR202_ga29866 [Eleusine coracana subsp. coracana]